MYVLMDQKILHILQRIKYIPRNRKSSKFLLTQPWLFLNCPVDSIGLLAGSSFARLRISVSSDFQIISNLSLSHLSSMK